MLYLLAVAASSIAVHVLHTCVKLSLLHPQGARHELDVASTLVHIRLSWGNWGLRNLHDIFGWIPYHYNLFFLISLAQIKGSDMRVGYHPT